MVATDALETVDAIVDEFRGTYRFYCGESIEGFIGLVNGFCLAREISPEPLWTAAPIFVARFLSAVEERVPWKELIERRCQSDRSQIPLFYAALDHHRGTVYERAWTMECDEAWRSEFETEERRINGDQNCLPAPVQLVLVEGRNGYWHIFYMNAKGERYFEATMRSEEKLRRWAASLLRLGTHEWQLATSGPFNVPLETCAS